MDRLSAAEARSQAQAQASPNAGLLTQWGEWDDEIDLEGFDPFALDNAHAIAPDRDEEVDDDDARERDAQALKIDAEWEDERQEIAQEIMRQNLRALILRDRPVKEVDDATTWLYVPGIADKAGRTYDLLCRALGANPDVVRAYAMYSMWRAGIVGSGALHPSAVDLPEIFSGEIKIKMRAIAPMAIAEAMWHWPGITASTLWSASGIEREEGVRWLMALEAEGYAAASFGRWYFVGRNPSIMTVAQRRKFSYARSVAGSEVE